MALQAVAALNILYLAAHLVSDLVEGTQSAPPLLVALGLALFSGVPLLAAALLRRLLAATLDIQPTLLVLTLRGARFEIPLASVTGLRPWKLPLPGPGLTVVMTSGRPFRYGLQLAEPGVLLSELGAELPSAQGALRHPAVLHAQARYLLARRGVRSWVLKFVVFPLVITGILFRLHQYIVFGGLLGEYHLLGLSAYLKTLLTFLAGTTGMLVVYAGVLRILAEGVALGMTWALPGRARGVRAAVEGLCAFAYFGLVSAYLLIRLLL